MVTRKLSSHKHDYRAEIVGSRHKYASHDGVGTSYIYWSTPLDCLMDNDLPNTDNLFTSGPHMVKFSHTFWHLSIEACLI